MMKRLLDLIVFLALLITGCSEDIKIPKQTKTPRAASVLEDSLLSEAIRMTDDGKYDEAVKVYGRILKENPDNEEALYEMAYTLFHQKKYRESLSYCFKGLEYKTDAEGLYFNLGGRALCGLNRKNDAIEFFLEAIKHDPDYSAPYYNYALILWELRKYPEAIKNVKQALALNPSETEYYISLSELHYNESENIWAYLYALRFLMFTTDPVDTRRALSVVIEMEDKIIAEPSNTGGSWLQKLTKSGRSGSAYKTLSKNEMPIRLDRFKTILSALDSYDRSYSYADSILVDYFSQIRESGYDESFLYYAYRESGLYGVSEWVENNKTKIDSLSAWDKSYMYAFQK